jgi:hypothetical protein
VLSSSYYLTLSWLLNVSRAGDGNWYAPPNAMPNEPLHPRGVITNEFLTGITQFINGYRNFDFPSLKLVSYISLITAKNHQLCKVLTEADDAL